MGFSSASSRKPHGTRRSAIGWIVLAAVVAVGCNESKVAATKAAGSAAAPMVSEPSTSWRTPRSEPLEVGDEAPDFDGIGHTGARIRLSALLDRPVAVFFYSYDQASETTAALVSLRDQWLELNGKLSMVLGVSLDTNVVHREFAAEHELPFLLLTDSDRAIMRAFGVATETTGPKPAIFVVGTDRKIVRVLEPSDPSRQGHALRDAIDDLAG